ncbi:NADPH-dependent F420 reductase [Limoniibacter endophyticus]|uniref:3-hydroxyisobutyrate dehydrogenase n=1 Tax=Limoniibacter endophyticus TaxID=1565040 RepID=A0A8J3DGQ6_9HYPH|nr:NAD(P)-binding domain-containing protein [Limoniibacter endophyticus]GHC65157.1 3-hydroxyisobutyrate dehydrogenase [Limoniibacter endophyticus]
MKIGILGTGNIGKTLVKTLGATGHDIKVANSRGPETIDADILASGARAVTSAEAVVGVDVVILSTPLAAIPQIAPLFADVPTETVVIDTSNYYPRRDGEIAAIEAGQTESEWVTGQLGRPIAKAWNAITSASFAQKGAPAGTAGRIAIPVAADGKREREVAMTLVDETGLDAVYSGPLSESWRQQPGAPCYCTDLTHEELADALASAERSRLPKRRELAIEAIMERVGDSTTNPDSDYAVRLTRALFM